MENKKYTVSELAGVVGVPRTTINDWLSRYSQYIDFKKQGRRKIYNQKSLEVLKEIAELRNRELSSFDIEEELSKRHPVHGEIHEPGSGEPVTNTPSADVPSGENAKNSSEEFALIARKQTDEIGRLISEQLKNISRRMDELEDINRISASRGARWSVFAFVLIFLVLIIGVFAFYSFRLYRDIQRKHEVTFGLLGNKNVELSRMSTQLGIRDKQLNDVSVELERKTVDFKKQMFELEKDLRKQEEEFKLMLNKAQAEERAKKQAEIFAMRDRFARERLELLKKVEKAAADSRKQAELVTQLQKQSLEQSVAIKKLSEAAISAASEKVDTEHISPDDVYDDIPFDREVDPLNGR